MGVRALNRIIYDLGLLALIVVPFGLIGLSIWPMRGLTIGLVTGGMAAVILLFIGERLAQWVLRAQLDPLLEATPQKRLLEKHRLRVFVFPDPSPVAIFVRSFGGSGSLLLSRGCLSLLSSAQFEKLIELSIQRRRAKHLVRSSLAFVLLGFVFHGFPRGWGERWIFGRFGVSKAPWAAPTVFRILRFAALAPFIRFCLQASQINAWHIRDPIDQALFYAVFYGGRLSGVEHVCSKWASAGVALKVDLSQS